MRLATWLGGIAIGLLVLTGCASGGGPAVPAGRRELRVALTFAQPVNPTRFAYFLIFNLDNDPSVKPLITPQGFKDRDVIGLGWDVYYLYGSPGSQPARFYRGRGGTGTDGQPLRDANGDLYILQLPELAVGPEIIQTAVTDASVDGIADPIAENTLFWRFDLDRFPSLSGLPNNPVRLRMGILVADRTIDSLGNPDDGIITDLKLYDRFFEGSVALDLSKRDRWGETSDPQEFVEEVKEFNVEPLTGPFGAADLRTWSVQLVE